MATDSCTGNIAASQYACVNENVYENGWNIMTTFFIVVSSILGIACVYWLVAELQMRD